MRNILIPALLGTIVMTCSTPAFADLDVSGTGFVGWGNDYLDGEGLILRSDINVSGSHELVGGPELGFSVDVDVVYNDEDKTEEFEAKLDDITIYADFGAGGKLSYSTEHNCAYGMESYIDGDVTRGDYSSNPVHTKIGSRFRCIGYMGLMKDDDGGFFYGYTNDYLEYENKFGDVSVDLLWDWDRDYDDTVDAKTFYDDASPTFEANVKYALPFATLGVKVNDLKDYGVNAYIPIKSANLSIYAYHDVIGTDWPNGVNYVNGGVVWWRPQNLGIFKGGQVSVRHAGDDLGHVVQADFGNNVWNAHFAMDQDSDWAFEGGYKISDSLEIQAGYDSGYAQGEGTDIDLVNPADLVARDSAWEIGLRFTF
jgi:hypothetical protein